MKNELTEREKVALDLVQRTLDKITELQERVHDKALSHRKWVRRPEDYPLKPGFYKDVSDELYKIGKSVEAISWYVTKRTYWKNGQSISQ